MPVGHTNAPHHVCQVNMISKFLTLPVICERDQKLVVLFVIHATVAVQGFDDSLNIFHACEIICPLIDLTWIPFIFIVSLLLAVLSVVTLIVIVFVHMIIAHVVISLHAVYVIIHVAVLKFHHVGAVSIIVPFVVFAGMSPFAPSAILICHNVTHEGDDAFAALSQEIFVHHVAAVTVTAAYALYVKSILNHIKTLVT